jgi:hypothetical protein
MKYTNKKNNISEILKVYIINSIAKSYILNIKIRPLVTEYALMIKLVDRTSSTHSFYPYAYFGHLWSYFDIQNLRLVILYILHTLCTFVCGSMKFKKKGICFFIVGHSMIFSIVMTQVK